MSKKTHTCGTCGTQIHWRGWVGNRPGKGWVHWRTNENRAEEPAPHNAFPGPKK